MILAQANEDSEEESEDEAFDEDAVRSRLALKLTEGFEEEEDEMDIDQMCDTPDSQGKLRDAWASLKIDEE